MTDDIQTLAENIKRLADTYAGAMLNRSFPNFGGGPQTSEAEAKRTLHSAIDSMQARIEALETLVGEAYVAAASMLLDMDKLDDPHAIKLLDNLSLANEPPHPDVVPWPSFGPHVPASE
jgi:NADH:ubiquinone oxidoreductase subunit D